jgi:hypothetical protein
MAFFTSSSYPTRERGTDFGLCCLGQGSWRFRVHPPVLGEVFADLIILDDDVEEFASACDF